VVGCSPAKGGGGENSGGSTGQSSGGNSGQNGGSKSGGTTSATGGNNNPSGGNNNPSGGNNNPSGGNNNPSGGNNNPSGGNNNPSGGNNNPSGGNNNPSGGNNNPSGGNKSGGTTSATGGNNNPSGGTTTSSGGTTTSSGGTTTSSGGNNPSGGTTSSTGGSTGNPGTNPPGWWQTSDWNVTSANWHGCVWTGVDSTVVGSTTSILPQDFTTASTEGGPYEVSGTVFNDYNAVAMIGFNLNESIDSSKGATQCKYNKAAALAAGPPVATVPSSATGIAINWSAKIAPVTSFRIQIQGVNGATDATDRWCATIKDASGPSFVKFSDFYPSCWNVGVTGQSPGTAYAGQPIDAVVFLVPGTITAKAPFDFTIVGFAPGTSAADAPGKIAACGTTTGTVGSTTQLSGQASIDAATQRAAVTGTDCKKYIINNNNWGNESGTYQQLSYTGNSFTDTVTSGSGGGANVVSFPSIYIGGNGQIGGGTFNTWSDSGLPKQISAMKSVQTSFKWSGGTSGGNYNAAYDVWFAKSPPTAGGYNDAVSGFIMVWLYKPGASQPIGSSGSTRTASIAGHTWTVWRGPRVGTATGTDGNGRPVISYVANDSPVSSLSFDLKNFIDDAVTNASADMSAGGGITQAFSSSWYLTDVFAGFEIWNGGDAKGLQDTFTCAVQ
jgi:hypothetical protein